MNICLVAHAYPGVHGQLPGGPSRYVHTLATGLHSLGHQVHVLVIAENVEDIRPVVIDGVTVHSMKAKNIPYLERFAPNLRRSWDLCRAVKDLHAQYRFDVIEVPNIEGMGYFLARKFGDRFALRMHTAFLQHVRIKGQQLNWARRFTHWLDSATARAARHLLTHSMANAEEMREVYALPQNRTIHVIALGTAIPDLLKSKVGRGPHAHFQILTVGVLEPRKGTDVIFKAIPKIVAEVPSARFTFVGRDSQTAPGDVTWQTYFERSRPEAIQDKVVFKGKIPEEELRSLYDDCDVYLSPTRYESFGLTLIEAMAYAKPVVSCRAGAVPELVDHGRTGLLVELGDVAGLADAIVSLARDAEMRRRIGAAAREHVRERFSTRLMVERTESLFSGICRNNQV